MHTPPTPPAATSHKMTVHTMPPLSRLLTHGSQTRASQPCQCHPSIPSSCCVTSCWLIGQRCTSLPLPRIIILLLHLLLRVLSGSLCFRQSFSISGWPCQHLTINPWADRLWAAHLHPHPLALLLPHHWLGVAGRMRGLESPDLTASLSCRQPHPLPLLLPPLLLLLLLAAVAAGRQSTLRQQHSHHQKQQTSCHRQPVEQLPCWQLAAPPLPPPLLLPLTVHRCRCCCC